MNYLNTSVLLLSQESPLLNRSWFVFPLPGVILIFLTNMALQGEASGVAQVVSSRREWRGLIQEEGRCSVHSSMGVRLPAHTMCCIPLAHSSLSFPPCRGHSLSVRAHMPHTEGHFLYAKRGSLGKTSSNHHQPAIPTCTLLGTTVTQAAIKHTLFYIITAEVCF